MNAADEASPPRVRLDVIGEPRSLSAEQELVIYRVAQEGLANLQKHASANAVQIVLAFGSRTIQLEICDDGQGFIVPGSLTEFIHTGSLGLMGMQERV